MNSFWRKYNGAIIPTFPPTASIKQRSYEIKKIIKESNVYFARWVTDFDSEKQLDFWYVIKDKKFDLGDFSSKTRNQIKKGLKLCLVREISLFEYINEGYIIYLKAFKTYKTFEKPMTKDGFEKKIINLDDSSQFWGVFNLENKLIGFSQNNIQNNICEFSITKFHPEYLKLRPSEALFYTMVDFYLNKLEVQYIHNGTRSIAHHTNIQEFLIKKFKFRKAYCKLHILYRPLFGFLVRVIFPLRSVIRYFPLTIFRKIQIILKQEEISRNCEKQLKC